MGFEKKGESYFKRLNNLKENVPELQLSKDLILPNEQIEGLRKIFRTNSSKRKYRTEEERKQYSDNMKLLIEKIVKELHDDKLGDKPGTITLAQSKGGSNDNVRTLFGDKSTPFAIIQVNGIAILEAIGEANNATFIGEINESLRENIIAMGRNEIVNRGFFYKITHERAENGEYNFTSSHILDLIRYAINYPEKMKEVAKKQSGLHRLEAKERAKRGESLATIPSSFCTFKTFKGLMGVAIANSEAEKLRITDKEVSDSVKDIAKSHDKKEHERGGE